MPTTEGPSKPAVSAGACADGSAFTISFSSTDPDGHQLRYGVDWDDDGIIDQFAPSSGYVDSGTTQSASRTYSIGGEKTIRVYAQNDNGAQSEWTTHTFNCNICPIGYVLQGSVCVFASCPVGYVLQGSVCVFASCPVGYVKIGVQCVFTGCPIGYVEQNGACVWSGCPANFIEQNNQCVLPNQCTDAPYCQGSNLYNGCTDEVIDTCTYGCSSGRCNEVPKVSATLKANPPVVVKGKKSVISWTSQNATSCTINGTNGDSWTDLNSTGKNTKPIFGQVNYKLHCNALPGASPSFVEKSVSVNVVPDFVEK